LIRNPSLAIWRFGTIFQLSFCGAVGPDLNDRDHNLDLLKYVIRILAWQSKPYRDFRFLNVAGGDRVFLNIRSPLP